MVEIQLKLTFPCLFIIIYFHSFLIFQTLYDNQFYIIKKR